MDIPELDPGFAVPSLVRSSYTPTLTALLHARRRLRPQKENGSMLAVGIPDPIGGSPPLPAVIRELEVVQGYFPMPDRGCLLVSENATREAVLRGLAEHSWAHLACHGGQDISNPVMGGVMLWNGPLTVLDIVDRKLEMAELAYLSACRTAVGGAELLDEAIHPAAALQVAGFRHVIATLWFISDIPAPDMADAFYNALGTDGGPDPDRAAIALADAVARLRAEHPTDPTIWAPYIHIGP